MHFPVQKCTTPESTFARLLSFPSTPPARNIPIMEALGGAATIIGVIETAASLFQTCLQYSLAVKDAKRDIQRLQTEAADLQRLLARVADLASEPRAGELPALGEVLAPGGPLQTCGMVM